MLAVMRGGGGDGGSSGGSTHATGHIFGRLVCSRYHRICDMQVRGRVRKRCCTGACAEAYVGAMIVLHS